jgi:hypothetical protein
MKVAAFLSGVPKTRSSVRLGQHDQYPLAGPLTSFQSERVAQNEPPKGEREPKTEKSTAGGVWNWSNAEFVDNHDLVEPEYADKQAAIVGRKEQNIFFLSKLWSRRDEKINKNQKIPGFLPRKVHFYERTKIKRLNI